MPFGLFHGFSRPVKCGKCLEIEVFVVFWLFLSAGTYFSESIDIQMLFTVVLGLFLLLILFMGLRKAVESCEFTFKG